MYQIYINIFLLTFNFVVRKYHLTHFALMHFCVSGLIDSAATEIDLSYNLIETISAGTFSNSFHCEILTLNYNSIHTIEAGAFQVIHPRIR